MTYVETSAIVGILLEEPDQLELISRLEAADAPFTSVVSAVEAALGVGKVINDVDLASQLVSDFLDRMRVRVVGVPSDIYEDVMRAAVRYGRRSGHAAKLNFGDCFSYAHAKRSGGHILFKGNDFGRTDLIPV